MLGSILDKFYKRKCEVRASTSVREDREKTVDCYF